MREIKIRNDHVLKVARKIFGLEMQLETVYLIMDIAFVPCEAEPCYSCYSLPDYISAWSQLFNWNSDNENRYGSLIIENYEDLIAEFNLLIKDTENMSRSECYKRKLEFCRSSTVVVACEAVKKYINDLTNEISKQRVELDKLYDHFAKYAGPYSFIFKDSKIKQMIIDELLLSC